MDQALPQQRVVFGVDALQQRTGFGRAGVVRVLHALAHVLVFFDDRERLVQATFYLAECDVVDV